MMWLGIVAVPLAPTLRLALSPDWRAELLRAPAAAVAGFVFDSPLIAAGAFAPMPFLFQYPFSSLWMVMLWVNLAMTLNVSMAWLRSRCVLSAVFGAVGGPMACYSGAKPGAMTAIPPVDALLAIRVAWRSLSRY